MTPYHLPPSVLLKLSLKEKEIAELIPKTLFWVKDMKNEKTIAELKEIAIAKIKAEPTLELEYFEISNMDTLLPVQRIEPAQKHIACIALKLGDVRLIDNIILD